MTDQQLLQCIRNWLIEHPVMYALAEVRVDAEYDPVMGAQSISIVAWISDKKLNLPLSLYVRQTIPMFDADRITPQFVDYLMDKIAHSLITWEGK